MPEPVVQTENIDKAYQWAINTCNAPNVGYSQAYRNQRTINGITYYDCSSFIFYSLIAGGWDLLNTWGTWPFTTYVMLEFLTRPENGFVALDASQVEWLAGDILLGKYSAPNVPEHTEMVYEGTGNIGEGYTMGAHGARGLTLDNQVSILNYLEYSTKYPVILRYGNGASGYGLTLSQVAGMCGNAWMESTVNPSSEGYSEPQDHARGLWSWTDWTGTNPFYIGTAMMNWMQDHGYSTWKDGNGQVRCALADDLSTGSMWSNTPIPQYSYTNAQYPDFQSFINAKTIDTQEACLEWFLHWESPVSQEVFDITWNQRLAFANKAYDFIREHANDTSISEWIQRDPPNHYLTEAEALNNCVMMWRIASTGGGGGTPTKLKRLPIYMMLRRRGVLSNG